MLYIPLKYFAFANTQVIVKNPDQTPAPGELIAVTVDGGYNSGFRLVNNFTSDDNGVVQFTIDDLQDVEGSVSIRVSSVVVEKMILFLFSASLTLKVAVAGVLR